MRRANSKAVCSALYVTPQPQDSIFLDICTTVGYNRNIKGAATSGWPDTVNLAKLKKPSLGRVAVSAFYPYRYGVSEDM